MAKAAIFCPITPIGTKLVIKRNAPEQKTRSGIIIPEKAQSKQQEGLVLATGAGKLTDQGQAIPMRVSVGQTVLFTEYGATEVVVADEKYVIIDELDILGILTLR